MVSPSCHPLPFPSIDSRYAVGSYDWICNWVGNERWSKALEWSGQEEFASQELREWTVGGVKAGVTRSAKGGLFTFATVEGAGHMVSFSLILLLYLLIDRVFV